MKTVTWLALTSVLGAVACGEGGPTRVTTATLSASVSSLALERTAMATVQATLDRGGAPTDVTAAASWTTSNPQVATVAAGVVTAVGPGTATIVASHDGRSVSVPVSVRRRVYLRGSIQVSDVVLRGSLHTAIAYMNGQWVNQNSQSGQASQIQVSFGRSSATGMPLAPSDHELSVQLDNLPGEYVCELNNPLVGRDDHVGLVYDKDTGELLDEIAFPVKTEVLPANARVTWRFTVKAYTS